MVRSKVKNSRMLLLKLQVKGTVSEELVLWLQACPDDPWRKNIAGVCDIVGQGMSE